MIELTFLRELMLVSQAYQKSAIFVTNVFFLNKGSKFQPNVCNGCHHSFIMFMIYEPY